MKTYKKEIVRDKQMEVGHFYIADETESQIYYCWYESPHVKGNYFDTNPTSGILLVLKKEIYKQRDWFKLLHLESGRIGWTFAEDDPIEEVDLLETKLTCENKSK